MIDMEYATEMYHRAIWALDGAGERVEQYWLMKRWEHVSRLLSLEGGDIKAVSAEVRALIDVSGNVLTKYEKDRERQISAKQRDYLLGVVARALRAARLKLPTSEPAGWRDRFYRFFRRSSLATALRPQEAAYVTNIVSTLHYYYPDQESFHADLGPAYFLWQGLRAELKMGITLANIPVHAQRKVVEVSDVMRNIIEAMEHGRCELLRHYEKSELQLSEEQYQQKLWEGVVAEMSRLLRECGRPDIHRLLA